jgi:hypothetical protein
MHFDLHLINVRGNLILSANLLNRIDRDTFLRPDFIAADLVSGQIFVSKWSRWRGRERQTRHVLYLYSSWQSNILRKVSRGVWVKLQVTSRNVSRNLFPRPCRVIDRCMQDIFLNMLHINLRLFCFHLIRCAFRETTCSRCSKHLFKLRKFFQLNSVFFSLFTTSDMFAAA